MSKCILKEKTVEEIREAVSSSKNTKQTLNKLGYNLSSHTNICQSTRQIFNNICKKHLINLEHFSQYQEKREYFCRICGETISNTNSSELCKTCKIKEKIKTWKETGNLDIKVQSNVRGTIRDYIYEKQDFRCVICGMENIWNGKPLNFILDHINGDASNNHEENLRLICPNCDSQLDTYKSKNKNSARKFR